MKKASASSKIMAVVVSYLPESERFSMLLDRLLLQVDLVLVVDNTPADRDDAECIVTAFPQYADSLRMTRCGENLGIAAALNIGINSGLESGYDYLLLSDQDSVPAEDMVSNLLRTAMALQRDGVEMGSVSPAYYDEVTDQSMPFQVHEKGHLFYRSFPGDKAYPWVEVLTSITSGSLVPATALRKTGPMLEELFIDDVDVEWGHRARHCGLHLFGTSHAVLHHRLGEGSFPVWYLRWRTFSGYSPSRIYYRFRNFVALCKMRYVPLSWKIRASRYWLGNAYAFLIFSPNRWTNARSIATGIWHGMRGKMGRRDFPENG